MLVRLARPFFYDKLYKPSPYGVEIPDGVKLPKDAVILEEPPKVEPKAPPKPKALSELVKPTSKKAATTMSEMAKQDDVDLE